ncbi:MAG: hypothetical protein KKE17_15785 [Proteobacteria bacterium]|nr:hypothetical protein [Pseudomonadota bacterium]MBU1901890.1 hypothetical protein [Patescibacteria group bacterium]
MKNNEEVQEVGIKEELLDEQHHLDSKDGNNNEKATNSFIGKIQNSKSISFGKDYENETDNLTSDNKTLWFIVLFLIFVIVSLLVANNTLASKTVMSVEIPSKLYDGSGKIDVTEDDANELYYKLFGQYFIRENTQFKADTHSGYLKIIEEAMTPTRHAYKLVDFEKEKNFVVSNNVSQKLIAIKKISEPAIQDKLHVIAIEATVQQTIGGVEEAPKDCEYRIVLYRQNWKLYVLDYKHTCFDKFEGTI